MKLRFGPLMLASMMVLVSLSGCIFNDEGSSSNSDLLAVFNYSPSDNLRAGDLISFDASSSTPNDGSLTYRWDFDNDSSVDKTGMTAEWTFDSSGSKVVTLTISDGTKTSEQVRDITIVEATAVAPTAEITQYTSLEDCENNDLDEETHIVVWMCHYDKSQTDRDVSETTTISLDASDSVAGDADEYISEFNWDLDLYVDSDNDGDTENDADLSGQTIDWTDVQPGEYKIQLNIKNSQDMVDSDTIKVYVSYAAKWSDFEMGGNNSGNGVELDFDVSISYDRDSGNTIKKAVAELTYPQQDGDCTNVPGANNCRAKLDTYSYNEEDEEASNTSSVGLDQRNDGDCDEANDCVFLTISSYFFGDSDSTYGDGDWTFKIKNDKANDLQVESFIIRLVYF